MDTVKGANEYKLSPKSYSIINLLKREIIGDYSLERNNFYLQEKEDFKSIKDKLPKILDELSIGTYKIDSLSFLINNIIIISILEGGNEKNKENNEEFIKIFYKGNLKKEIKDYINNILLLG